MLNPEHPASDRPPQSAEEYFWSLAQPGPSITCQPVQTHCKDQEKAIAQIKQVLSYPKECNAPRCQNDISKRIACCASSLHPRCVPVSRNTTLWWSMCFRKRIKFCSKILCARAELVELAGHCLGLPGPQRMGISLELCFRPQLLFSRIKK